MEVFKIKKIRYLFMKGDVLSILLLYIITIEINPNMIQRNKNNVFSM